MSKRDLFRLEDLKKQLTYILSRRPDEFGLVPDEEGFIKIKELLQALHEEPGFGFVRESHINELLMLDGKRLFEIEDKRIRAKEIDWEFDFENPSYDIPKILYTCVRRRAYPFVMEKGLISNPNYYIILSSSKDMALRIGKRKDQSPVLLEIRAHEALNSGSQFVRFGELYLSKWISHDHIIGPRINEEEVEKKKREKERRKIEDAFSAGTFIMREPKERKGKKKKGWKEEARKVRKRRNMEFF